MFIVFFTIILYNIQKGMVQMSKKLKLILIISLIIIFAIIGIFISKIYINYLKTPRYIKYSSRDSYIINNVDENLLKNYISKKQNTLVIFWASWCPACLNEAEAITNFITNNPDIQTIIVSHDKEYEDLENYLKDNNLKWQVIFDKEKTIRKSIDSESTAIPACFVLNTNQEVLNSHEGLLTENEILDLYNMNFEEK